MPATATFPDYALAAYRAHPLLDPHAPRHSPALARLWLGTYRRLLRSPAGDADMVRAYSLPLGSEAKADGALLADYFSDADAYLDDLLDLVPAPLAKRLRPLAETRGATGMLALFRATFEATAARERYEAQRKLYLAHLLFTVDHCRSVLDGPRHHAWLDSLLEHKLWAGSVMGEETEVCCLLEPHAGGEDHFAVVGKPRPGALCWRFRLRRLPADQGEPEIDVYDYRSRFKREAATLQSAETSGGGRLEERPLWPLLGRRSGSIVSKLIRRVIADPSMVQDVLGARFIVGDRTQAYGLERRLIAALGGPLRWRDREDTLGGAASDRDNPHTARSFAVLKAIVDLLIDNGAEHPPYLFPVEIQIYPVEAYMRTLHDDHFASHAAYKRRQFLQDLLPALFPEDIFGEIISEIAASGRDPS